MRLITSALDKLEMQGACISNVCLFEHTLKVSASFKTVPHLEIVESVQP